MNGVDKSVQNNGQHQRVHQTSERSREERVKEEKGSERWHLNSTAHRTTPQSWMGQDRQERNGSRRWDREQREQRMELEGQCKAQHQNRWMPVKQQSAGERRRRGMKMQKMQK